MTLKQEAVSTAQAVLQNPKVAWGVTGTTGILATLAEWINGFFEGVGSNAASIAGILSIVLIFNNIVGGHLRRKNEREQHNVSMKKFQLEIEQLKGDRDG